MGVCNCSMFCCTLLYVHFSIAIILMGKRELIALLNLSSWCLVMVERLFLTVPLGCLQFVIVVFPDHTHLLFSNIFFILGSKHFTSENGVLVLFCFLKTMFVLGHQESDFQSSFYAFEFLKYTPPNCTKKITDKRLTP